MNFKILLPLNYFIFLLLISNIICQTSNFKVKGKITVYENTIATKVCCQGQCINYNIVSSTYFFSFDLKTLGMGISVYIKNKNYIPGSRIGAYISSTINSLNFSCGSPSLISESIYLNDSITRYYSVVRNNTKYFELPDNITGTYTINFNYGFKEKYTCNSQTIFVKKNSISSFTLSSLVTTLENVNGECCNEYNITVEKYDSGYIMEDNNEMLINTTYQNPHITENDKKINFTYDEIGCYSFQYSLSQENYASINTCIKKYIICYKTCETCFDCDGNVEEHKCNICINGYYKKVDGNNNCYTEEEKKILFPNYFLNKDINKFDKCYFSCGTCRLKGNKNKHKCDTCAENYYPTEGNEYLFNCYNDEDKPNNYYFNKDKKLFVKCNPTCNECSEKGESNTNSNCLSCIKYHHFYSNEPGNCIMEGTQPINYFLNETDNSYQECYETCKTCSKYKDINSENCISCDQEKGYFLIYNQKGNCINEVPGPDYYLNPINLIQKQYEKCNINFCVECSNDEWFYISRYIGNSFYCINNDDSTKFNLQIYQNSEPLINKSQSYINQLDIIKCENILKNESLIGKREEIIVVKKDYLDNENNEIKNIDYYFYRKKKKSGKLELSILVNISSCNNLDFLITIPRNLSNYYTSKYINIVKTSFEKFHYDLFNPKDSIYRDICLPFYIDSSDLTLKDRSSLFLPNNLCPENCIYKSIKFFDENYLSSVNCICKNEYIFSENISEIVLENNYFINNNLTNIGILKCYNAFGNGLKFQYFNLSFILYLIILLIYIFLLFRYFFVDMHKFRAKIFESLKKSHSAYCKLERNDSSILNERIELYNNNNYITYNTKILALKVSDDVNLNNMPYNYSLKNDDRNFISMFYSILIDIDFLFGIFFKKNQFKITSLSICIFVFHLNLLFTLNSFITVDNIISYKFLYDSLPMKKIFINAVILICIHFFLVKFVYKYYFISEKLVEFLIEEYKNVSFYFSRIQNFVVSKHQKSIFIFSISLIFISFGIYYNITFCHIFVQSQIIWFEQIIICFIGCLLINCILSLIVAGLRIAAFKYQKLYIYNASLILKGLLNRD